MTGQDLAALAALRLTWAPVPDDAWRPSPFHVDGLHTDVVQELRDGVADAAACTDSNPIGLALLGRRGSGKTHLLGGVRQRVQEQGGYFFLVSLLDEQTFWPNVLAHLRESLARPVADGGNQLRLLLRRLCSRIGAPRAARRAVMGEIELTPKALNEFLEGLREFDSYVADTASDTARALALSASPQSEHRDVADAYFISDDESVAGERKEWGIRRRPHTAEDIVRDLSLLLALTGPSVIAVDQIDTLVAQASLSADLALNTDEQAGQRQALALEQMGSGLLRLRERTRRTLVVVACLPATWTLIINRATNTTADRFRLCSSLKGILDADIAREIVERRFTARYHDIGFVPDYTTWPVRESVFAEVDKYTPRQLLKEIDRHVRDCLKTGVVRELTSLSGELDEAEEPAPPVVVVPEVADDVITRIDARFEALKRDADVASPLDPDTEDTTFPALLTAGLTAWILEHGVNAEVFTLDPPPSEKPDLHARLRRTLDEATEDQVHWCFRAVSDTHHAIAALNRVRRARTAAGLTAAVAKRKLILVRNGPWSSGAKTRLAVEEFHRDGGLTVGVDEADLRVLAALHGLRDENPVDLQAWLVKHRPAAQVKLFKEALADADDWAGSSAPPAAAEVHELVLGREGRGGDAVRVPLEALRKHVAIFAGSGSGKTVLIRRLIEECALQGVSAIVLDPNNDLARLGDAWPEPPRWWGSGDRERAEEYLAGTEVVVWTPRRESGRPLSFQPLPDFGQVRDDPDEFAEAVEAAVAALAPRAQLAGRAAKVHLGLAVLRRAVEHYARQGGRDVPGLIHLLADLPAGVSGLDGADKIAAGLAQTLTASMDNDPLFAGSGAPADPGVLLTPTAGKRARISVISLIGLPAEEARQGFVNQLQMALFAWIKKHPAADRPLLGLFVMDEAQTLAPSGAMTACTQSTLALASQARKYGLGLIFATQAPKGLHNRIAGNATTQFFGLLNAPVQIEAAREMARMKGGDIPDLGLLTSGEFYVTVEGEPPQLVRTPLCLSHHPRAPLTDDEVVARARR
ncbi:ATP-binding protein [Dactylosporangium siamense]|uniref:ATPase n=1 Tax=Dactylosporangium siamense TaxID=685454 RepID=A0A919PYD5_9ACTN|nr:ATP-binding protein [Dactylosporangium siamense]GIG52657.1 ATPase [Dactylosporangium siamense]